MSVFSERLRLIMRERGITQKELSEKTGIPKSAISQYLADRFKPKRDRTFVICRAIGADPAWLIGLSDSNVGFEPRCAVMELDEDEQRLVTFFREHPDMREDLLRMTKGSQSVTEVFRAAKSDGGTIAPVHEKLSCDRLKRLSEAPETDEDL